MHWNAEHELRTVTTFLSQMKDQHSNVPSIGDELQIQFSSSLARGAAIEKSILESWPYNSAGSDFDTLFVLSRAIWTLQTIRVSEAVVEAG